MKRKAYPSEADEQIAVFDWARAAQAQMPELSLMFHIPNGGSRHIREAVKFKRMGVKAGVPDIFLPVPRGNWHGLFLELKSAKGKLSLDQRAWLDALQKLNYWVAVSRSATEAIGDIQGYLSWKR